MRVTKELLEQWGACRRGREWFTKTFPDGGDKTIEDWLKVMPEDRPNDKLWFLYQTVMSKDSGKDGDAALKLFADTAKIQQAQSVVHVIKKRDPSLRDTTAAEQAIADRVSKEGASDGV